MTQAEAKRFLAHRVRNIRASLDLSQDELATKIGCSGVHVSQLERGRHLPTLKYLLRLGRVAGYTDAKIRDLFLLRKRAELTPHDFEVLYGELAVSRHQLSDPGVVYLMTKLEEIQATVPEVEFELLYAGIKNLIQFMYNRMSGNTIPSIMLNTECLTYQSYATLGVAHFFYLENIGRSISVSFAPLSSTNCR